MPEHIGIIMDGNRRWSKENDKPKEKGHLEGRKRAEEIVKKALEMDIKVLSLYTFSTENLKRRPEEEKEYLFKLFAKNFNELAEADYIHENQVKILVSGRWRKLPEFVQESIQRATKSTNAYNSHYLNFCIVYDGRDEIVDATKKISRKAREGLLKVDEINRDTIKRHLYHDLPNPDLIIRTGMKEARRLSGFLLWGSAYSEFKFRRTYWPDYTPELLEKDIKDWAKRRRSKHGE